MSAPTAVMIQEPHVNGHLLSPIPLQPAKFRSRSGLPVTWAHMMARGLHKEHGR